MKYIFIIASIFQSLYFAVFANDALENYYKSMAVLNVYHEKFTTHLRNKYLQLSLGPRSIDYSTTTLLLEEDENNVPNLIMRKEDIRWNHLYLSATPLEPITLAQNFANGFAWFSAFREMLNFRVGALYYKKKDRNDLSKNCSMMAAYLTMFQLILIQDRLYEFGNIIDDYNNEKAFTLKIEYFKRTIDSKSGRDALATAKNMELLSKVTEVLNQVVEYRTVRRQFPVQPSDPWIFPSNEKRAKSEKSAVDIVKEELAFDFYLREEPETKVADSELKEARFEISEGKDVDPLELEQSLLEQRPAEKETGGTELKDEASASTATEEPVAKQKEPSEEEKEKEWREHSDRLQSIDDKYNQNADENYDVFYHKCLWKELLAIYGDAFVQVIEYFHFAISGSSYKSAVQSGINSFEDYVPNMDENVAVWETAEELYAVAKADYQSDKSSPEKELRSHPVSILQKIETTRFRYRSQETQIDENLTQRKWTLQYVNPANEQADLKVV